MNTTTTALAARPVHVLRARPVWLVSALAGVTGAVATELYGLAAGAVGIPMSAGNIGASVAEPITVGMFAMGTLICTFWGTVLAVILARYATRPARAYVWTTVALTVVSLAGPLAAGDTATSTKLMLALAHLLAAAIIIPTVTRRLPHAPGHHGPR
ncbi:MAG: putative rane protein [Dactylosporangium sp.]|nr:putative rane protein [Dactylosporangium sp.]